jgi:transposase
VSYPSDLSDAEWSELKPLIEGSMGARGGRRKYRIRDIINALLYITDNGVKWRALPNDFPPWASVYQYKLYLERRGAWGKIHAALLKKSA